MQAHTFSAFTETMAQNQGADSLSLFERHQLYFETQRADTQSLLERAQALRYQVYCVERKFENPDEHAHGLERDEYDQEALHGLLFYRPENRALGTVRMIPTAGALQPPIVSILREQNIELGRYVPLQETAEISRFAISKDLRRRHDEQPAAVEHIPRVDRHKIRRDGNLPCLSLIQFLVRESTRAGIRYWGAVMEPKLLRMLAGMGIHFTPVGGLVMHHGLRQPGYCNVPEMLCNVEKMYPEYWEILTNKGKNTYSASAKLKIAV